MITDTRGENPKVYRLEGDPKQLAFHVGHTLEVAGTLSAPQGSQGPPVLKVASLVYISATCTQAKK